MQYNGAGRGDGTWPGLWLGGRDKGAISATENPETVCVNPVFPMFCHLGLTPGGPRLPGTGDCYRVKDLPASLPFLCKAISVERTPQPPPLWSSYTPHRSPPALVTPGSGPRQRETAATPQSPTELFKVASPKPAFPSSPCLPYGNQH